MECVTTGFSVQDVVMLLAGVLGVIAIPVTPLFRALLAANRELLDLSKDQNAIQRDQVETLKAAEMIKSGRTRRA